ncbi:hypothetical protein Bca4012_066140 [Brassica carinata]
MAWINEVWKFIRDRQVVEPPVQKLLKEVQKILAYTLLGAALGGHLYVFFSAIATSIFCVCAFGYLFLRLTESWGYSNVRLGVLLVTAFLKGVTVGSLMEFAFDSDVRVYVTTLVGGALLFPCLYATTSATRWRDANYGLGMLAYAMAISIWLCLSPWILGGECALSCEACGCYLAYGGYTCKNLDNIIDGGTMVDPVTHALSFFVNVLVLFQSLLTNILSTKHNDEKKAKEEKERK